ncbi:30S ribosomal protein S19e [archaeon]|nr:30S ribosomal protein S19e [archaeon]|tara:strand:- start:2786 stop:3202 length:417 start_codon:yes stop_codon:yes gene_type:complete
MVTIYDVDTNKLIESASEEMKKLVKAPEWTKYVKTGVGKERAPIDIDWYYKRTAAILRKVYMRGPLGTNKLRTLFGNRKNRGMQPERFRRGSGKIIRTSLQQLEEAKLIKKGSKGTHKGRLITNEGVKFLDSIAKKVK